MSATSKYVYHAYVFGTSFWYFLRALIRIYDPVTVVAWFRPPRDVLLPTNDLEIYTTRTDAFGLLTLAGILLVLADAVPLPKSLIGSTLASGSTERAKRPYARAVIVLTLFHHITTGIGSYSHWIHPTHRTTAMDIGVFGNLALTVLGVAALVLESNEAAKSASKSK